MVDNPQRLLVVLFRDINQCVVISLQAGGVNLYIGFCKTRKHLIQPCLSYASVRHETELRKAALSL